MTERLQKIFQKNAEFEKESPYNFCDRWCERCVHEKQICCTLYKNELERKLTCIAHGRDEDDPEITKAVLEAQYQQVDDILGEHIDKFGIALDNPDIYENNLDEKDVIDFEDLPPEIKKHIRFVENNALDKTARNYFDKVHAFLKETFYENKKAHPELKYDFETLSWYHALLPAKLHRALCGFHEPASEGNTSLYDAVAQFQICKKAITQSVEAFRKINRHFVSFYASIQIMLALLHNIYSRIEKIEESIG